MPYGLPRSSHIIQHMDTAHAAAGKNTAAVLFVAKKFTALYYGFE